MKFTLAFHIYNKEKWIESVLDSWISNLSTKNEYKFIFVFDGLKDNSKTIVEKYLIEHSLGHQFLFTDNQHEIFCNNLALENTTGGYIVFIQDDNWMYDKNWDLVLREVINRVENIGAVGFLAGLELSPPMQWRRMEINRPHKGTHFFTKTPCGLGVWKVDAINRPLCISTKLLKQQGGLDKTFMPSCGDDLDLSIRLLKEGKTNIYIPFDLLNTSPNPGNLSKEEQGKIYARATRLCKERHKEYLETRQIKQIKMLFPLETKGGELCLMNERPIMRRP